MKAHQLTFRFLLISLSATLLTLGACGDDERGADTGGDAVADTASPDTMSPDSAEPDTTAPDTMEPDTASPDTTAPDTIEPDTVSPETVAGDADAVASGCSEDDLQACFYPSRGLDYAEVDQLTTEDPVTGRTLPLLVRVPAVEGPVPVVIWMHGGGFNDNGHRESVAWGDTLARHGYLVIHVASARLTLESALIMCELAQVPEAECGRTEDEDDDANGLLAVFRSFDLVAVLEDLPRLSQISVNNGGPALDLERVAVGGWSGGSRGPQLVMGASTKPTASAPLFSNPNARARAAFLMSPAGPGFGGFFQDEDGSSWEAMRGPTLVSTGTNDQKPLKPELTGAIRRVPFDAQPADGERWLLYSNLPVGVGEHGTYNLGGLDSPDERVKRLSFAISSATRAFLDAYVRDDAAAAAWLASDDARVLAGEAEWLNR